MSEIKNLICCLGLQIKKEVPAKERWNKGEGGMKKEWKAAGSGGGVLPSIF